MNTIWKCVCALVGFIFCRWLIATFGVETALTVFMTWFFFVFSNLKLRS